MGRRTNEQIKTDEDLAEMRRNLCVMYHEHDTARFPSQRMRVWRSDWFGDQFEIIERSKLRDIFHGVIMCGINVKYVGTDSREIDDLVHPQVIVSLHPDRDDDD